MFQNLKVTFRNLYRNSVYSVVNIVGLAVSLTVAIFILLWVQDELGRNKCFDNAEQIYQYGVVSFPHEVELIADRFPEVLKMCHTSYKEIELGALSCEIGERITMPNVYIADSAFFSFFNIKFLFGNSKQPFENNRSIVLTESVAKRLFKDEDPLGKVIQSSIHGNFYVTAVIADFPKNSSLQFNALIPTSFYSDWMDWINRKPQRFTHNVRNTYLMLPKNTDIHTLEIRIAEEVEKNRNCEDEFNPETDFYSRLIPITKGHLYDYYDAKPTGIKHVRLFSSIVFILLLIAVINYVNLVTARLIDRTKEVEIRKIFGESKLGLFMQMMRETMMMVFLALILATVLIEFLLPFYNILTEKQLDFNFTKLEIWTTYLALFIVVSISAGIYPAMRLISFKSTGLGSFHQTIRNQFILRKILIVAQFTFSLIFITVAIVVNLQMHFMKETDSGFLKENIFKLPLHNMADHYDAVKQELLRENDVADVTATNAPINSVGWMIGNDQFWSIVLWGDYNVLDFFNIPILEGTGFSQNYHSQNDIIFNDKALRALKVLNFEDPIGAPFELFGDSQTIIGKVSDFHFNTLRKNECDALMVMYNLNEINYLYVKTIPEKQQEALAAVKKIWKHYNDGYPFEYRFIEDDFAILYKEEIQKERLFNIFACIAILVSCLGLFGLITYTAETKTKEIGIRKVYGASIKNIIEMLTKEFIILIGISMLIAFPCAYLWLNKMLQDYAYRISISWWMFALAAIIAILLTLLTVGTKALRAATMNPAKSIKN